MRLGEFTSREDAERAVSLFEASHGA
jgi:hypothetical protein